MEIIWKGNTCFNIKDKGVSLVINPYKGVGKVKANIVLTSLNEKDREEVEGVENLFDWPGEYETKDISITALQAWTKSRSKENEEGNGDSTLLFCFEMGGIKFCHLDDLGHMLTSEMVKEIGDIDVLMINGGKDSNLGPKKAQEIVEAIEPRAVAFMGEEEDDTLLKELGGQGTQKQDKVVLKSKKDFPEDKRTYLVFRKD